MSNAKHKVNMKNTNSELSTTDVNAGRSSVADVSNIWGMSPLERQRKQFLKLSISPSANLVLRPDVIYDDAVLIGLVKSADVLLLDEDATPLAAHVSDNQLPSAERWLFDGADIPASAQSVTPAEAGGDYNRKLRKRAAAKCYVIRDDNAREIEWQLYLASYKGVTDLVTKYIWPHPAYHVTRFCARHRISPNMVTSASAVLTLLSFWLFWEGQFSWGLLSGWLMTFLDTVDGKLARVTLTASEWGNIFDHGIDLIHPPFWYLAWGFGLLSAGLISSEWLHACIWAVFAGYIGGRLIEGYFIRRHGFHIHVWRRFDSFFRLIVARRNPNLILLTLSYLGDRPELGFFAVVAWTLISVPVHLTQSIDAEIARARGKQLTSWLSN
jgi:phosphatidylglycerophosphate synthase